MKKIACIYKGVKYTSLTELGNKVRLLVCEPQEGFKNVVEDGEVDEDVFYKDVSKKKLDRLYTTDYKVRYQGEKCETMSMNPSILKRGYVSIVTTNVEFAKNHEFRRFDVFEYIKDVPVEEIDKLLIEEQDLLGKQSEPQCKEVDLIKYLKEQ